MGTDDTVDQAPLAGVRVVELAQGVFVPAAGALMADWRADVIRVDGPGGDSYRGLATQGIGTDSGGVNLSVYVRGNGYGMRGPHAGRAGYDASAFFARGGGPCIDSSRPRVSDRAASRNG